MADADQADRIVILSDTHLGRPSAGARGADALRPLWRGADRLIINGDAAELADDVYRVEAARHVLAIQQACEADGVELTLLPGNHDPMISDARYLRLRGGEVFVTHGDAIHPAISPWTVHRAQLQRFHAYAGRAASAAGQEDPLISTLAAAQYAAHLTWDDWHWHPEHTPQSVFRVLPARLRDRAEFAAKVARVLWYWHTLPRRAARFAERFAPDARFFIFGHIHRAGVWRTRRHILINTGSYDFPARPHAVVIDRDTLAFHRIIQAGDAFSLRDEPLAAFPLMSAA